VYWEGSGFWPWGRSCPLKRPWRGRWNLRAPQNNVYVHRNSAWPTTDQWEDLNLPVIVTAVAEDGSTEMMPEIEESYGNLPTHIRTRTRTRPASRLSSAGEICFCTSAASP
jgi:hypothetical protein